MKAVFADTGYWIALFHPRDRLHSKAVSVSQSVQDQPIITSHAVLTEFLNHFAAFGPQLRLKAVEVVNRLQQSSQVEIVPQTPEQFEAALTLYSQRPDKQWGLTDCTSFLIMQHHAAAGHYGSIGA